MKRSEYLRSRYSLQPNRYIGGSGLIRRMMGVRFMLCVVRLKIYLYYLPTNEDGPTLGGSASCSICCGRMLTAA